MKYNSWDLSGIYIHFGMHSDLGVLQQYKVNTRNSRLLSRRNTTNRERKVA